MSQKPTFTGYDGRSYTIGDRVELHPGTDMWMRGARYGTVVGASVTERDRVRVELDKVPGRKFFASEDTFRKIPDSTNPRKRAKNRGPFGLMPSKRGVRQIKLADIARVHGLTPQQLRDARRANRAMSARNRKTAKRRNPSRPPRSIAPHKLFYVQMRKHNSSVWLNVVACAKLETAKTIAKNVAKYTGNAVQVTDSK